MLVQEREVPSDAFVSAVKLLSQLIGVKEGQIKDALTGRLDPRCNPYGYKTVLIPKGRGRGTRRLDIPSSGLREVQRRLLRSCLYWIETASAEDWDALRGFRRLMSIRHFSQPHIHSKAFLQLDIKDAFPSTTTEMLRNALEALFERTVVQRMFRFRNVYYFKKWFLREGERRSFQCSDEPTIGPLDVLWALREIIIWLTTYQNRLPQGAPTSPHLFNLVVADQRIPTIAVQALSPFYKPDEVAITLYADNITISTLHGEIPREAQDNVVRAIESQTPFRINPKKTRYSEARRGSPQLVGLSIGEKDGQEVITVPQAFQKRARGLLHSAISTPKLRPMALGMAAYLMDVFGGIDGFPQQIRKPYEQLLAAIKSEET